MIPAFFDIAQRVAIPPCPPGVDYPIFYTSEGDLEYILVDARHNKILAIELHWGPTEQESWLDADSDQVQGKFHLKGSIKLIEWRGRHLIPSGLLIPMKKAKSGEIIEVNGQKFLIERAWPGFVFARID